MALWVLRVRDWVHGPEEALGAGACDTLQSRRLEPRELVWASVLASW